MLEGVLWPTKNPLQRPPKKADWEGGNIKKSTCFSASREKGAAQAIANRRAD